MTERPARGRWIACERNMVAKSTKQAEVAVTPREPNDRDKAAIASLARGAGTAAAGEYSFGGDECQRRDPVAARRRAGAPASVA